MVKSHSADGLAWAPNRDLTRSQLDDRAALYADRGYLVVNVEGDEASPNLYGGIGGIWIKNAKRFRFSLRDPLDVAITNYLATYTDTTNVPLSQTGISVDVIQNGDAIYRHGLGMCDPTMAHLADLPDHHTRTVEQLTAHLGCVVHYPQDTQPGCANCTTHSATALDVAEAIWGTGLVRTNAAHAGCTIGATRSYSTHAFTLLGAVLEEAAGRTITQLLERELFEPHGLASLRVQFASATQVADYERAVQYDDDGNPLSLAGCGVGKACGNSWKVLGGSIEGNALDLARFGWRVLAGQVVDAMTHDDRLWTPVDATCAAAGGGTGRNGVGWVLRTVGGWCVAVHGGSWTGARSHLRVYRDDGLVIAILTNERGHTPSGLATTIGNIILAP